MKKVLLIFLFFSASLFAEDSIQFQLSSFPPHADIYLGSRPSSFVQRPLYSTPATIRLPLDSTQVLVTLFKKDYADTTIDIKLSPNEKGEAFITIMLKQELNEKILEQQKKDLFRRAKKDYGKKVLLGTIPASVATIINVLILQYHIRQAEEISQEIEETIIRQNDHFNSLKDEFRHHKHHAENFKRGTVISAAATSLFLIVGCTLSF